MSADLRRFAPPVGLAAGRLAVVWLAFLMLVAEPTVSYAQVERSGGGVNAQLAQQYQQAVADRAQLQSENDGLKKQLDSVKMQLQADERQLAALKTSASTTASQLAAAQASRQSESQTIAQYNSRLQDVITHYRDVVVTLRGVETQRTQLQQQLAQGKAALDHCARNNSQLSQLDDEVLNRYEHQGFLTYMARREPFTRLKRAQIENLVDGYRERASDLRVDGAATGVSQSSASGSAPSTSGTAQ